MRLIKQAKAPPPPSSSCLEKQPCQREFESGAKSGAVAVAAAAGWEIHSSANFV